MLNSKQISFLRTFFLTFIMTIIHCMPINATEIEGYNEAELSEPYETETRSTSDEVYLNVPVLALTKDMPFRFTTLIYDGYITGITLIQLRNYIPTSNNLNVVTVGDDSFIPVAPGEAIVTFKHSQNPDNYFEIPIFVSELSINDIWSSLIYDLKDLQIGQTKSSISIGPLIYFTYFTHDSGAESDEKDYDAFTIIRDVENQKFTITANRAGKAKYSIWCCGYGSSATFEATLPDDLSLSTPRIVLPNINSDGSEGKVDLLHYVYNGIINGTTLERILKDYEIISENEEVVKVVDTALQSVSPGDAIVKLTNKYNDTIQFVLPVTVSNRTIWEAYSMISDSIGNLYISHPLVLDPQDEPLFEMLRIDPTNDTTDQNDYDAFEITRNADDLSTVILPLKYGIASYNVGFSNGGVMRYVFETKQLPELTLTKSRITIPRETTKSADSLFFDGFVEGDEGWNFSTKFTINSSDTDIIKCDGENIVGLKPGKAIVTISYKRLPEVSLQIPFTVYEMSDTEISNAILEDLNDVYVGYPKTTRSFGEMAEFIEIYIAKDGADGSNDYDAFEIIRDAWNGTFILSANKEGCASFHVGFHTNTSYGFTLTSKLPTDDLNGISQTSSNDNGEFKPIYNLLGHKVAISQAQMEALPSGLYIRDGKKIFIRK